MVRSGALLLAMAGLLCSGEGVGEKESGGQRVYLRTTVAAILAKAKRMDGKRVELRGDYVTGFEISLLTDGSRCGELGKRVCGAWIESRNCVATVKESRTMKCYEAIREFRGTARENKGSFLEFKGMLVRGIARTINRDIRAQGHYRTTVQAGFGHLGAGAIQVDVEEMEFPQSGL
jgi:hypothetical protein